MKTETDVFVQLLSKCGLEMYAVSYRILKNHYDAEDAVANAILRAFQNRDTLRDRNKFKPWLLKILINETKLLMRRNQRIVTADDPYKGRELIEAVNNGYIELRELISSLEKDLRDVIILYYYQGYSTKEMAELLHKPKGTILSRLSRARDILKRML